MSASLDEQLGIDTSDPIQRRASELVDNDYALLSRLVALRREKNLTQTEVGIRMGVSEDAVRYIERPDADPHLSTLRRYALAVGASIQHTVTQ
jgi:DNA-binding XRE family transcriptional regulator